MNGFSDKVAFIESVADLLRGPYKPAQYGKVIVPLTVLRRLDCVLEPTKQKVLDKNAALKNGPVKDFEPILNRFAEHASSRQDRAEPGALHQEFLVEGAPVGLVRPTSPPQEDSVDDARTRHAK